MGDTNWPCQKPPWGRLTAINTSTGDIAWQIPLGITEQLSTDKQNTGRPALAGPIATASGLVFIASTDDNRFRALDVKQETACGSRGWRSGATLTPSPIWAGMASSTLPWWPPIP